MEFRINPDITKAETLPASFYRSQEVFEMLKEKVFFKSWQLIEDPISKTRNSVHPFLFLEGLIDEPLVLTSDSEKKYLCLSNVCTHRGNLIAQEEGTSKTMVCRYHGRCFDLQGNFISMPEFKEAKDFPREEDKLKKFPLEQWGPLLFTALLPQNDLTGILQKITDRIGFLPLEKAEYVPSRSKVYSLEANWALYCDNFLEGFHIPFVHKGLNEVLHYPDYEIELNDGFNVQIGRSNTPDHCFEFPSGHPDHGKNIAAYYYWVFPNLMVNVYPWGLSINIVKPKAIDKTEISFLSYVFDESKLEIGAGGDLHKVEMEDEEIVKSVQKGVNSRFYKTGRFSPKMEKGVHHFQTLLSQHLNAK